jgi:5-methylcytosine-specific restriction protein A
LLDVPGYCVAHQAQQRKADDARRGSAASRGYNSRWRRYREVYLKRHPLCVHCLAANLVTEANVVDHITPHKGSSALFWLPSNHQALCKPCHDRKTSTEDGGFGRSASTSPSV